MRAGETKMYSIHHLIRRTLATACSLCGMAANADALCEGCSNDILRIKQQGCWCVQCAVRIDPEASRCAQCQRWSPAFTHTVTAIDYAYPGALLIRRLKVHGQLAQANLFARMLALTMASHAGGLPPLQAIVPIPASDSALRKRGFNPAAEIARALSGHLGLPMRSSWLRRTRESALQKSLRYSERRESVRGLYACREAIPGVWIGVVDDVLTSGATMHEAALTLKRAGALGVVAIVASRTTW